MGDTSRCLVLIESDIAWRIDVRGPNQFSDQHSFDNKIKWYNDLTPFPPVSAAPLKNTSNCESSAVQSQAPKVKKGGSAPWTAALLASVLEGKSVGSLKINSTFTTRKQIVCVLQTFQTAAGNQDYSATEY